MSRPIGEIEIMGPIGADYEGGISAASALKAIKGMGDVRRIKVTLNSPGGSAFDGVAIYNALKDTGKPVDVHVLGLAASAASIVAMAGDTVTMHEGAMLMIHRAWALAIGNAEDLTATAALLKKLDGEMAGIYAGKSTKEREKMLALMSEETWLTGAEAVDLGLADETKGARNEAAIKSVAAMLPQFKFAKTPDSLRALMPAALADIKPKSEDKKMPEPEKKEETTVAPATPAPITPEQVASTAADAVKAERERAAGIMAAAKEYGLDGEAQAFIASGATVADAKAALADMKIKALESAAPNIPGAAPGENPGAVKAFEDAVLAHVAAGLDKAKAIRAAIAENKPRHEAYLAAINRKA